MSAAKIEWLLQHCADIDVEVEWLDLGLYRRGDYCDATRTIRINTRLADWQALSTLIHETGHAAHRHRVQTPHTERQADETGMALTFTALEYAAAEKVVGTHAGALAVELDVTVRLVLAWRRWWLSARRSLTAA